MYSQQKHLLGIAEKGQITKKQPLEKRDCTNCEHPCRCLLYAVTFSKEGERISLLTPA